jgi:hypothetical protein
MVIMNVLREGRKIAKNVKVSSNTDFFELNQITSSLQLLR